MNNINLTFTSDKSIRAALRNDLADTYKNESQVKIIEELGITHGAARVDIAVVGGVIHGYELKSDLDSLYRLPEQMRVFNSVLDQITLVVGKNHLYEAINMVPDWWGIMIAKIADSSGIISFCNIREADDNPEQDNAAIASLLWRKEALTILEEMGCAKGVRSKARRLVYERLATVLDHKTLRAKVRERLLTRVNWRSDLQCMPSGD
jgi:hypothetical protein